MTDINMTNVLIFALLGGFLVGALFVLLQGKPKGYKFEPDFVWLYFWPIAGGVFWNGTQLVSVSIWRYSFDLMFSKVGTSFCVSFAFEKNDNLWREYQKASETRKQKES